MPLKSPFPNIVLTDSSTTFHEYILNGDAIRNPDDAALIDAVTSENVTFAQVRNNVHNIARGLISLGLKKGDIVAVCLRNCIEFVPIALAIMSSGGVYCGICPYLTAEEYAYLIGDCRPHFIFASLDTINMVKAAENLTISRCHIICMQQSLKDNITCCDATTFSELIVSKTSNIQTVAKVSIDPKNDLAYIFYTSGTTGKSKGVMVTHQNVLTEMKVFFNSTHFNQPEKGDSMLAAIDMYSGFMFKLTMTALRNGAVTVIARNLIYESEKCLSLLQNFRISKFHCVRPTLVFLAGNPTVKKYDLSHLRVIWTTSSPTEKQLADAVKARLPNLNVLSQSYGMTELGGVFNTPKGKAKSGSCGVLVPSFSCKIVNQDTGKECGRNEPGEICLKGPILMKGYYNDSDATNVVFDNDGWFHTGDIGYHDEDEYFFIVSRIKDIIKVHREPISPAELEEILASHEAVREVIVVGKPHREYGEVPKAYVVKNPGVEVTEDELIKFLNEKVAFYKRLAGGVEFINEIPKSSNGKTLRRVLQEREKVMD